MVDLLFAALMLLCCGYASVAGERDGRLVTLIFVAAWLVSFPPFPVFLFGLDDRKSNDIYQCVIDIFLYAGLWAVARASRGYWPVWLLGLHFANLSTDLVILFGKNWDPLVTYLLRAFWSIPELLLMPIGIHLDRNAGILRKRPGTRQ